MSLALHGLKRQFAAMAAVSKPSSLDLSHLALSGAELAVRVTPKASRNALMETAEGIRAYVTCVPEGGRANAEVCKLLARALGVAKTRVVLVRGQTSRDKVFRIEA